MDLADALFGTGGAEGDLGGGQTAIHQGFAEGDRLVNAVESDNGDNTDFVNTLKDRIHNAFLLICLKFALVPVPVGSDDSLWWNTVPQLAYFIIQILRGGVNRAKLPVRCGIFLAILRWFRPAGYLLRKNTIAGILDSTSWNTFPQTGDKRGKWQM